MFFSSNKITLAQYSTPTPTATKTPTPSPTGTPTATPTPSNWYKLKNASLYKIGAIDLNIASSITAFDMDDDASRNLIIGEHPGVVSSTGNIVFHSSTAFKSNANDWQNADYSFSTEALMTNFYDYIKARKTYEEITAASDVVANKVNIIKTDSLTLDGNDLTATPPFVLIVRNANNSDYGNLTITENVDYTNVVFLAKKITFESAVASVHGIFLADSFDIKSPTDGFKVVGNLVSNTAIPIPERTDKSKPSIFVVVDPNQYISLLPLISTSKYDFQQTQ